METWNAITSRRNVRDYSDEALPESAVDRILEAARRAPSARNAQWWDLIVVDDTEQLRRLSRVWGGAGHVAGSQVTIAITAPEGSNAQEQRWIDYDLGQLTMQAMIAAADLGIGTGHANVEDQDLARRVLGFPQNRTCHTLIAMGYPADRPLQPIEKPSRRDFDDVVHRGTW